MPLTISSAQASVAEGATLDFAVAATAGDDAKLVKQLSWAVLDASGAIAGSGDFAATSGELPPITPGKTSRDFAVTAAADGLYEGGGAETFSVEVRSDSVVGDLLAGLLEATATFTVQDGDAPPVYSVADAAAVAEGGELVFAVAASAASTAEQTLWYTVDGGAEQSLVIPAGATAAEVRVETQNNATRGANPDVVVELVSASLGSASGEATGAVADDDGASVYAASGGGGVAEGGVLEFAVARTGGLGAETLTYTLGGSATASSDYAALSGSLAFQPGEATKAVQVRTYLDAVREGGETVVLNLAAASDGGVFDGASATGTVADLDPTGMLRRQVAVDAGPDGNVSPSANVLRFADGWTALDGRTDLGSALRLYQATLGRDPDPIGLGFWTDALETGTLSLADAAEGFMASPEFQARYGGTDDAGFVDLLYQNVLGRAGEAGGITHWTGTLASGAATRAEVVLGFSESAELVESTAGRYADGVWVPAAGRFSDGIWAADPAAVDAMRFYETVLDRQPDAGGLLHWIDARERGLTLGPMADAFTSSAEFEARYGALSNQGFVERLYLNALDRPGEAEGIAHWAGALEAGALSRADVVAGFAMSHEMAVKLTPFAADGLAFV